MEAKAMEESSYYLVPRGLLSLLSHTTKNHVPRVGTAANGLASTTSIINQENAPQTCLQSIQQRHFLNRDSLAPHDSLACAK